MSIQSTQVDPLYAQPRAERPFYATGMLLDAQDFSDEQSYHRGRLARSLAFLAGSGTLAGLQVTYVAGTSTMPEEIRVEPGLAVDRLGRLIEVARPACLRLANWFATTSAADGGDMLLRSARPVLPIFVSPRLTDTAPGGGGRGGRVFSLHLPGPIGRGRGRPAPSSPTCSSASPHARSG
jgi:hypothetical protein